MSASTAVLRTEARLFRREPGALFWILAFPTLLLAILGLIPSFRKADPASAACRTVDLYVPVVVLLAADHGRAAGHAARSSPATGSAASCAACRPLRCDPSALLAAQIVLNGAAALGSAVARDGRGPPRLRCARCPRQPLGYSLALLLATLGALALGRRDLRALPHHEDRQRGRHRPCSSRRCSPRGCGCRSRPCRTSCAASSASPRSAPPPQALNQAAAGDWPSWSHLGVLALWTVLLIAAAAAGSGGSDGTYQDMDETGRDGE